MPDTMILPSGAEISIDRPDFSVCRTSEDFMEIKYALSEKIVEIELQIDMQEVNGRMTSPDWLPRAKASLRYAKLYRDEAQSRQGQRHNLEKAENHAATERGVIEVLRGLLPQKDFDHLIKIGSLVADGKFNIAKART